MHICRQFTLPHAILSAITTHPHTPIIFGIIFGIGKVESRATYTNCACMIRKRRGKKQKLHMPRQKRRCDEDEKLCVCSRRDSGIRARSELAQR